MEITTGCPSNCKYIHGNKCIATECIRKVGTITLPRIIHPNPLEWFVQFEYTTGIIDREIFYSEEKAQKRLKELLEREEE